MIFICLACTCISLVNIASQGYVDTNINNNNTKISSDGKYNGVDCSASEDVVPSMKYVSANLVDIGSFDEKVSASVSAALSGDANLSSTVEGMVEDIVRNMTSVVTETELNETIDALSDVYVSKLDIRSEEASDKNKVYSTSYINDKFSSHTHPYIPTSNILKDASSDTDQNYQIPTLSAIQAVLDDSDSGYMKKSSVVNAGDEDASDASSRKVPSVLKVDELIGEWFDRNYEVVDKCE